MLGPELAYGAALLAFAAWLAYAGRSPMMGTFAALGSGCCAWALVLLLAPL